LIGRAIPSAGSGSVGLGAGASFAAGGFVLSTWELTSASASLALLGKVSARVHTITSDNGREFASHERIAAGLRAKFYFAHPYSSWERGLNENTNGLVRQYFPKKSDFSKITDRQIE